MVTIYQYLWKALHMSTMTSKFLLYLSVFKKITLTVFHSFLSYQVQSANDVQVFLRFFRNLVHKINQHKKDKVSEHNRRKVFVRVPTGGVKFVFYPSSSFNFNSSLFSTSLVSFSFTTIGVRCPPHTGRL